MPQRHDLGVRKRLINSQFNPQKLSHDKRVEMRKESRLRAALDLHDKTGRWPRGFDPDDKVNVRRLRPFKSARNDGT